MMPAADRDFDSRRLIGGLQEHPGIYQMLDREGEVLYVGKARNLKKRVASYFQKRALNRRTLAMLARVREVQVTVTASETEALLLEQNLIKEYHPPYNILLRDDKSYPCIRLSEEEFPRLSFYRGARRSGARYFGPYPGASAVRDSLNFLYRTFRIRQCENSVFRNRSRPCLQYEIKRCSAPCVGLISAAEYAESVADAEMFLQGNNRELLTGLSERMEAAAAAEHYERAAELRDQVAALNQLQEKQYIEGEKGDVDILAAAAAPDCVSVQMLYVRAGRVIGSRGYFPRLPLAENPGEALAAFIPGFYLRAAAEIPRKILLSHPVAGTRALEEALERRASHKVRLQSRVQGARLRWLRLARETAEQNLQGRMAGERQTIAQLQELREALQLEETPRRLECFDISHSGGIETVASCVVFDQEGARKSDYRRYIIRGIAPGDDYAALRQALLRRYRRVQTGQGGALPDVLLVDGGPGQLRQAREVWDELGLGAAALLGVAKGRSRRPGRERLWTGSGKELRLAPDSGALHLVQRIRDEAHRFAIQGHRRRRSARSGASPLAEVPGIGPKRRRMLLRSFGGLQGIRKAAPEEIARTPGISLKMAEDILAHLRRN